jgi:hypothetical protein
MSDAENSMAAAIQEWLDTHGIKSGKDAPILKVSLVGYADDGTPLFEVRPAYGSEILDASLQRRRN